ncbi:MAG: LPS export ABC transporter periplasmic protein LptC [Armatimonadota bacterium]
MRSYAASKFSKKMMTFLTVVAFAVIAVTLSVGAPDDGQPAKPKKESATINGDHWKVQGDADARVYTITGNVIVKYQDMTMTSDRAVYTKKTEIVVAEGNFKIVDPENDITGTKGVAYLKERRSVVDGNVKLVTKPKGSDTAKNEESVQVQLRNPSTITCDKLEYFYKKKVAAADGNIKVTQKKRVIVAQKAVYDVKQELLTLTGGVKATDEKGQTFTSPGTVKASLKEGAEWLEADNGSATVEVNLDDETEETEKTPPKPQESSSR